ncbi:hypothetical protein [Heyndrickxia oleronia]|uniref:Uncharacterized protein n=1 Tax=Heyndrickxia oleronia TaxID=38875 RepID=A0AAW6SU20_9BACI|nr:hypothetical protein [Heyndrickxia oleronia]MDH5160357.1 hypothetical protein [Heyndrickxia oleronia]
MKQEINIISDGMHARDKRVMYIAMIFIDMYLISLEEAIYHIEHLFSSFDDAFDELNRLGKEFVQCFEEVTMLDEIEEKKRWEVNWDTRRKSQVLLNKPKYLIRKVIS